MKTDVYIEKQSFNQWWLWLILGCFSLLCLTGLIIQVGLNKPFGTNPAPDGVIIGLFIFSIILLILFILIRLVIVIDSNSIRVSFGGIIKKEFSRNEIVKTEIVDYGFIGGWGIRFSTKYGKVYSTGGSKGLFIQPKNGNAFVIGTRKPEKLREFLNQMGMD